MDFLAPFAAALIILGTLTTLRNSVLANQRRIERKLDRLLDHAGLTVESPASARVLELATTFRMAEAIKLYRAETGADLAEAKAAIDGAVARHRANPS